MQNQTSNIQSTNEFEVNKNKENNLNQKIKSVKFKNLLETFEKKSSVQSSTTNNKISNNDNIENINGNSIPIIKKNFTQNFDKIPKKEEENNIKTAKTKNEKLLRAKQKILMMNELNKKISLSKDITGKAQELEKKITNDFDNKNNKIKKRSDDIDDFLD